jgi:hypothetical protein
MLPGDPSDMIERRRDPSEPREPPPPVEVLQESFSRIEAAVDEGRTDLRELGYGRLLRQVKADPMLSAHWADQIGRIDRKLFERRRRVRLPVWLGNLVLLGGTAAGAGAIVLATRLGDEDEVLAGLALVASAGILMVSVHDLAHWVAGRLAGIRFLAYYLDGPFRVQPGLKTDYATYLQAQPGDRAVMHAAGAVASKVAPFVAAAFFPATEAPGWALWATLGLGVIQIVTDVAWSTRKSDWMKAGRERRIARSWLARR